MDQEYLQSCKDVSSETLDNKQGATGLFVFDVHGLLLDTPISYSTVAHRQFLFLSQCSSHQSSGILSTTWHSARRQTSLLSHPQKAESIRVALLTSGEGNWDLFPSTGATKSMSCRIVVMCWAMTFCCSTLQWFSREMMTGYGEV